MFGLYGPWGGPGGVRVPPGHFRNRCFLVCLTNKNCHARDDDDDDDKNDGDDDDKNDGNYKLP